MGRGRIVSPRVLGALGVALVLGLCACGARVTAPAVEIPAPYPVVMLVNASTPLDDLYLGQYCGGVLTEESQVLTAAHCLADRDPSTVAVVAGVSNLCDDTAATGVDRSLVADVSEVPDTGGEVVALRLDMPLAPPEQKITVDGNETDVAIAVGWGRSSVGGVPSCELRQVSLDVVDAKRCADLIHSQDLPDEAVLCTVPRAAVNTCSGDSGGPVYVFQGGVFATLAVIESGAGCGPDAVGLNIAVPDVARVTDARRHHAQPRLNNEYRVRRAKPSTSHAPWTDRDGRTVTRDVGPAASHNRLP